MNDLRHLQLVILSIAKDIDAFCTANNIQYSLNGGSAIGAIRHQGFIPWDDDFDLQMTADNYRRFVELARKEFNNEPTLKSKIIDFSDCTTTDFRAAMAMEFYSIKCQFLIRT